MVRQPQAAGEASQSLGAELAAYRHAAGLTQAGFARLIEYSRSTVANVETGRQHVPRNFWERADRVLRTGGVLATAHDEIQAAARRQLRAAAHSAGTARRAPTGQQPTATTCPAASSAATAPAHLATAAERPPPGQLRRDGSRPCTPGDLTRLRSMRQHLKAIDNAHGGGAVLPMAEGYLRRELIPMLNERNGEPASQQLIEVAAQFHHDVGWMAYDAGQQQQATRYFTVGLRLAHAARNRLLGARILAAMSHQAIDLGQLQQAVDFARAARNVTRQVATPRTVAMLAAMEACAHAAAGDGRQSQQALDAAADALTLIPDGQPEPDWLDFDEGGYWGHAARAYRDLGQPRQAEEYAAKSVGLCLASHSRTHAQRTTILATAYLHMGEIDAAAAAAEQVVREAWNLHSSHVFGEVAQLAVVIRPFKTPVASEFLDQAHELLTARGPAPGGPAAG